MQTDGSLVMYRSDGSVRYSMAKRGKFAIMQSDCNFVQYSSEMPDASAAIWHTGTWNQCPGPGHLVITDTGDLRIDWFTSTPYMGGSVWSIGADPSPVAPVATAQYPMEKVLPASPAPSTVPAYGSPPNTYYFPNNYTRY